jgi:hypothetical protein
LPASIEARRTLIDADQATLSIRRQCELLDLPRSTRYYRPATETDENLLLMRLIDEEYMRVPIYGSRKMLRTLAQHGYRVNRKRVQRLMRLMGIEGLNPRGGTSRPHPKHKKYPYLLRTLDVVGANQVWATDISVPQRSNIGDEGMAPRDRLRDQRRHEQGVEGGRGRLTKDGLDAVQGAGRGAGCGAGLGRSALRPLGARLITPLARLITSVRG